MFENFYHLTQNPFQINTDPRFLWLGEKHKEALAILQYGVLGNKSFLLLTGDVGTGKTTLINALLKGQGDDALIASIQDPDLSTLDLYNYIAYAFGMSARYDTKGKFLVGFRKFLEKSYYNGKKILLIIDEAQRARHEILEDVRVLSNIEVDGNKLINIFFVGQNEFNDILLKDENKAIRQRITISYNIKPLTCDEVGKYIQFRLFKAGAQAKIFKNDAIKEICKVTKGYPRLINILCDRCLLTGFVLGQKTIGRKTVKECFAEIDLSTQAKTSKQDVHLENKPSEPPLRCQQFLPFKTALPLCLSLLFLAVSWFFFDDIKKIYQGQSSTGISAQEEIVVASSLPIVPNNQASTAHSSRRDVMTGMTQDILNKTKNYENETAEKSASLLPVTTKDGKNIPSGRAVASNEPKKHMPLEYGTKMQIFFKPDSISPAPEYVEALKTFSDRFIQLGNGKIVIRGYTDRSGTARYNKKLAKFRADVVKTFLEGRGVDAAKIITIGVISAASSPGENSITPTRQLARRVELEIVSPDSAY